MPTTLTPLTAVPLRWQDRLRCALGALRTWQAMLESARDTERLFGSPGRYEWEVRSGRAQAAVRAQVTQAEATLAEFARLAPGQWRGPRGGAGGAGRTAGTGRRRPARARVAAAVSATHTGSPSGAPQEEEAHASDNRMAHEERV